MSSYDEHCNLSVWRRCDVIIIDDGLMYDGRDYRIFKVNLDIANHYVAKIL